MIDYYFLITEQDSIHHKYSLQDHIGTYKWSNVEYSASTWAHRPDSWDASGEDEFTHDRIH
eukprot:scaffold14510_cov215-Skeletonema_marinoi.AAC.4